MGKQQNKKAKQLGRLSPQHDFFLNPYIDARFTRCPQCDQPTKVRKKPLLIFINLIQPVCLNKTCHYCPKCDLLIAHQNELDELIAAMCLRQFPQLVDKEYLVVGTMERQARKQGFQGITHINDIFNSLHDFKQHLEFEPTRYIWVKED